MRVTSAAFASYVDASQRWSDARVRLKLINETAQKNAQPLTYDWELFELSDLSDTVNGKDYMSHKFAVLDGTWALDGRCTTYSDGAERHSGFWGKYPSDYQGNTAYTVEYTFRTAVYTPVDLNGLTIFFDDKHKQWATDFTIRYYRLVSSVPQVIDTVTVTGHDSPVYTLEKTISNIVRVELVFTKTSEPNRLLRFSGVEFGIVEAMDKKDLVSVRIIEEASVDASALPYGVLEYGFNNSDRRYDPTNPQGIYSQLREGLPIDVEIGLGDNPDGIEYVDVGRYYFYKSEYREGELTAKIIAYDILHKLDGIEYPFGRVGDAASDAQMTDLISSHGVDFNVGDPVTIGRAYPVASIRECVRLTAQASRKTCIKRDEALVFIDIADGIGTDGTITTDRMIGYPNLITADRVGSVDAKVNRLTKTASERSVLFDGFVKNPSSGFLAYKIIHFPHAATELIVTINGIQQYGMAEYLRCAKILLVGTSNDIVIEGYRDEISGDILSATLSGGGKMILIDNPLINSEDIAQDVADWLIDLYQHRTMWEITDRGDPRLQIGDKITLNYRGERSAVVVKQEFIFDGALSARTTLLEVPT